MDQTTLAIARSFMNQRSLSVKDFGAKGDGVADDTAAIQAALNAAVQGRLIFPRGTYNISSTLIIPQRMIISGSGMWTTTLRWVGPDDGVSDILRKEQSGSGRGLVIEELRVLNAPRDGIHLVNVHEWVVRNCILEGNKRHGLYHETSWKGYVQGVNAYNNGDTGIYAGPEGQAVNYYSCWCLQNTVGIRPSVMSIITGCSFELNRFVGILVERNHVTISGNYYESENFPWDPDNPRYSVLIRNTRNVTISGDRCMNRLGTGLKIENSENVNVTADVDYPNNLAEGDYPWFGNKGQLAFHVDKDSKNVRIFHIPNAPYFFERRSSIITVRESRNLPDLLQGIGGFAKEGSTPGLGRGWRVRNNPQLSLEYDNVALGIGRQVIVPTGVNQGLLAPTGILAKPEMSFTLGFLLYTTSDDHRIIVSANNGTGRINDFTIWGYPGRARFITVSHTKPPESTLDFFGIIDQRPNGYPFALEGVKLVEGIFDNSNFPWWGEDEGKTRQYFEFEVSDVVNASSPTKATRFGLTADKLITPSYGYFERFAVRLIGALDDGEVTAEILINGVNTGLSVSLAGEGEKSLDFSPFTEAFLTGDTIEIEVTKSDEFSSEGPLSLSATLTVQM